MRGNSTFMLLLKGSLIAAVTCGSFNSFGQTCQTQTKADCDIPVTYNFDDLEVGSTGGFSGDFRYAASQSGNSNSSTYLESNTPFATTKTLVTPTFDIPAQGALLMEYTFELRGSAKVSSFDVYVIDGNTETLICDNVLPDYPTGSSEAFVCASTTLAQYGLAGKQDVRLKIVFTLEGGGNQTVTFDNFGLLIDNANIVLPVNFTGLTAKKATKGTEVRWTVAEEMNVSRYEVQKGSNAGDLKTIGIVFA